MTVIIFSRITTLGETFDVFAIPDIPRDLSPYFDRRDPTVGIVLILPSLTADFRIVALSDAVTSRRLYTVPTAVAAHFMTSVRGLPLEDISFETPIKIHCATRDPKTGNIAVKLPKCKLLLTKKPIFVENIELYVSSVSDEYGQNILNLYRCENLSGVSGKLLREMTFSDSGEQIIGSVAYTMGDGVARATAHLLSKNEEALLTIAAAVHTLTRAPRVFVGEKSFDFSDTADGRAVSDPTPEVLTLYTRD